MERSKEIKSLLLLFVRAFCIALGLVTLAALIYFSPPVLTKFNGSIALMPMPPGEEYNYDTVANVKRDEFYFKNKEGMKLHGWFFQSPKANAPVVLFNHGNAGNIGHRLFLAKWILEAGASVFLYDYRGFGKSEGKKDLQGLIDDSKAAYEYLTVEKKIAPKDIILYGESIGGGPTCSLAATVPEGGIILDSTFTSLLQIGKKKVAFFRIYPDFLQPIPAFNNLEMLKGKHAPLLIIHGKQDTLIPFDEAEQNYAEASEPKQFLALPNSSHNDKGPDADQFIEGLHKFFAELKEHKENSH